MGKRKSETLSAEGNSLEDLVNNLKNANEEIKTAGPLGESPKGHDSEADISAEPKVVIDIDTIRREIIKCSEDGEINQSVKYLQKASAKVIMKIHKQLEVKRLEKANVFITDMLLSRFADTLGGLDAIQSSGELNSDLQKDKLLKRDVEKLVAYATPFLPFLGLISGALTTGKHIYKHCSEEHCSEEHCGEEHCGEAETSNTPP